MNNIKFIFFFSIMLFSIFYIVFLSISKVNKNKETIKQEKMTISIVLISSLLICISMYYNSEIIKLLGILGIIISFIKNIKNITLQK